MSDLRIFSLPLRMGEGRVRVTPFPLPAICRLGTFPVPTAESDTKALSLNPFPDLD